MKKKYKQELLNTLNHQVKIKNYDKKNYLKIKQTSYKKLEKYNQKTINFYKNFFWQINQQEPEIFLNSSWNEANEIVFKFLEEIFWKDLLNKIYVFGWYYEINETTEKHLEKLDITNYQDILPTTKVFWFEENAEPTPDFKTKQKKLVDKFKIIKNIANKKYCKQKFIWKLLYNLGCYYKIRFWLSKIKFSQKCKANPYL